MIKKTRLASEAVLLDGRNTGETSTCRFCLSLKESSFPLKREKKKKKYKNNGYKLLIVAYNSHNPREFDH